MTLANRKLIIIMDDKEIRENGYLVLFLLRVNK